jgi:hypothetical protein
MVMTSSLDEVPRVALVVMLCAAALVVQRALK